MRHATRIGLTLAIAIITTGLTVAAEAQTPPPAPQGADKTEELMLRYNLHPAFVKLGRGLGNFLMGWLELPLNIQQRYQPSDAATSVLTGAAVGLVKGAVRTGVGLYETVTFLLPYPEQFAPILPTLEYMRKDKRRQQRLLLE
jgi:putative exosortase-associated protein (TIGR04073 family)